MVVNFIWRASKADKSGLSPLEVSIIINDVRRYVHLDRKVKAADFNAKTQKVKRDASTNEYHTAIQKMKELRKVLKMCVDEGVIPASPFKTTLKLDNRDVNPSIPR